MSAAGVDPADPARCSAPYRVRFDEAAPDGFLRTSTLLRYAQDLAWFHSSQLGFTRAWYAERGLVWLARAAEVGVERPIRVGDELTGTTLVLGARRVWARRRTEFTDSDGTLVAWTHVDWVLLDGRGAPTRIPPEFGTSFGMPSISATLARVDLPPAPAGAEVTTFAVRPQELDPMDHANNAVYADWLDERVIAAGGPAGLAATRALPRLVRLEYARAVERDATVTARIWHEDGWSLRLADPAGDDLLRARLEAPKAG